MKYDLWLKQIAIIILLFLSDSYGKDYLILVNPENTVLYNQFEQRLTEKEISLLLPLSPLLIVREKSPLSDNFTFCLKLKLDSREIYILYENYLQGLKNKNIMRIKNVSIVSDSSIVLKENKIWFTTDLNENGDKLYLSPGEKALRIFRKSKFYFIKRLNGYPEYGWVNAGYEQDWKNLSTRQINNSFDEFDFVHQKINATINEANTVLETMFNVFNKTNNDSLGAPYWSLERQGNNLFILMQNKQDNIQFVESTNAIITQLQFVINKTDYRLQWDSDRIVIKDFFIK